MFVDDTGFPAVNCEDDLWICRNRKQLRLPPGGGGPRLKQSTFSSLMFTAARGRRACASVVVGVVQQRLGRCEENVQLSALIWFQTTENEQKP